MKVIKEIAYINYRGLLIIKKRFITDIKYYVDGHEFLRLKYAKDYIKRRKQK